MNRKEFALLALLTVVSGLIGGALSNRIFSSAPAFAQGEPAIEKCIQAESFQLLDPGGNVRAELCIGPDGNPGLAMIDENFVTRVRFALGQGGRPSLSLTDENRRLRAHIPLDEENLATAPGFEWSKLGGEAGK